MYFANFPMRYMRFPDVSGKILMTNILKRVNVIDKVKNDSRVFFDYVIKDEERPDIVAHKAYGDTEYYFLVLLVNDIHDPYSQWPMSYKEVAEYVTEKYGSGNEYAVHHYESKMGIVVDADYYGDEKVAVTNMDYEERLNEEKRNIKLLNPEFVDVVMRDLKTLMKVEDE